MEQGRMTGAPLYIGVDGGATRCRARLRDADGTRSPRRPAPPPTSMSISLQPSTSCAASSWKSPGRAGAADRTGSPSALASPDSTMPATRREVCAPSRVMHSFAPPTTRRPPASALTPARTAGLSSPAPVRRRSRGSGQGDHHRRTRLRARRRRFRGADRPRRAARGDPRLRPPWALERADRRYARRVRR